MASATGVDPTNGLGYIGNDDYRGYLNYLGSNGDANAQGLLAVVGNDGKFGAGGGAPLNNAALSSNSGYYTAWGTPRASAPAASSTAAGSGTSAQTIADNIAALDDAIGQDNSQLGSTKAALSNGLQGIQDDFNKNSSRYNQDQTLAQQNYDKQRASTTQDKVDATDAIYANGNTLANSVRRIIGLASGMNSTAYQQAAPDAIAKDMTVKTDANNATFKKNYDAIDSAQNDTNLQFQRNEQDLNDKTAQARSALQGGIDQQEQSILADIANNQAKQAQLRGGTYLDGKAAAAGATAQAQARQAAIDNLFSQYRTPYTYQAVTPTAATTADYNKDPSTLATPQAAGATDDTSPYAQALKKIFSGDQTTAAVPATPTTPAVV